MDNKTVNYYKILNISQEADADQIKKAYKYLVLTKHPDVNKSPNASAEFMQIIKAYNILRDDDKRASYDESLKSSQTIFDKINFKYVCEKVANKSSVAMKKIGKMIKSIAPKISTDFDASRFSDECEIPPEVMAMSLMDTTELEMRLQASDNKFVRAYSALALGVKHDRTAIAALENALHDPELNVREKVIWAIGKLKMKKSLPLLKKYYENSGTIIRQAIIKATYEITGGHGRTFKEMVVGEKIANNRPTVAPKIKLDSISAENKMINV